MTTTRQSIADALSTVTVTTPAGADLVIHGYPERPTVPLAGDAWPLVGSLDRGPGQTFETTWRIAVLLAGDVGTATDMFDALIPAAIASLQAEVFVDGAIPLTIPTEAGQLYGVEITARSE